MLQSFRLCSPMDSAAHQGPLSMGFSSKEYWSGLPCPPPGDLPHPGIEPGSLALQVKSLPLRHQGSPFNFLRYILCFGGIFLSTLEFLLLCVDFL